ncbi:hypothetical protein HID58_085923 [Brassica napus]|uniref:Ubiquitin-like protease family profile domain-containing protein n=1 Tax=Brassica napus TaxID=3708 RepID=A0ABQ7XNZ0_BRANA|nr:hypothetical protein HID58_085923 [Brassica napus]
MEDFLLPPRMFATGEEPLGERVNSYHKIKRTELLIEALEPEELEFLRNSTFGKILAIEENPPFSGAFGQYVVVRLLKVNKKYEVWFIFAGNPVRMSLREFAIVTGLNCRKIPEPTKKRKNPLKEKLYWNELLGSLKFCTVVTAIDMLKKKVVKSKEARIKFACLAITSSILFPSSHTPRIIPEHVELIRDLDDFLAFPWGRASYHTLATSLISKDEIALSQASVAIHSYVDAIQLVLLAAIPQLKEEITQSERTVIVDSESESENPNEDLALEGDNAVPLAEPSEATKYCLIPGHAKSIDIECQVTVKYIIDEPYEEWSAGLDFSWVDESEDFAVENLVRLIGEGFSFCKDMFKGGLNASDLLRLRGVKKLKEKEPKEKNDKDHAAEVTDGEGPDSQTHILIANLVASQLLDKSRSPASELRDEISSLEKRIYQALDAKIEKIASSTIQSQQLASRQATIVGFLQDIDKKIGTALVGQMKIMQASILNGVTELIYQTITSRGVSVEHKVSGKFPEFLPQKDSIPPPPVNGNPPVVPDTSTPSEAADFRISKVLRDLNIVPDHSLPANTVDNLDAELDTANGSSLHTSIAADSQLQAEQRDVQVEDLVTANYITKHAINNLDDNKTPDLENNQSLGVTFFVVENPDSEEFEKEEEDAPVVEETPNPINYVSPPMAHEKEAPEPRKSKRSRIIPAGLQDYKCDPKVNAGHCIIPDVDHRFTLMEQKVMKESDINLPNGYSRSSAEFLDIAYRNTILPTGVVDALIGFVSRGPTVGPNVAIYDTTLPVALMNHNNRFVKSTVKDHSKLKFADVPLEKHLEKSHERIYFPFNMDKQHWVGVCIDTKASTLHVLDCNTSFRSDSSLKKELNPIATLLPYVLKQFGFLGTNAGVKAFTVSRCKGIPQVTTQTDSGVMTVLLIEAHAGDGLR